jgi:hypothetical protein
MQKKASGDWQQHYSTRIATIGATGPVNFIITRNIQGTHHRDIIGIQSVSAMTSVLVVMLAVKKRNAVGRHSHEQPFFSDYCSKERFHDTKEKADDMNAMRQLQYQYEGLVAFS